MSKPVKVVLWDIETKPAVAAVWTLYPDSIPHDNILSDWSIVSIAWKELGKKTTYCTSVLDDPKRFKKDSGDDYYVVKKMREVLEDVDVLVGHNSKKFDTKKFNARLIHHGLPPLPSGIQQVDTLQEVKKVATFTSHRLDYLCKTLVGAGKIETHKGLWMRVLKGEKKAVEEMVHYNKGDVTLLEELYLKIRPYMKSHPHMGALDQGDRHMSCPKCGSNELIGSKIRHTAAGVKKVQKQCKSCHSYSTYQYKVE
jgi:DNA polymerase elongation subunit (family B)